MSKLLEDVLELQRALDSHSNVEPEEQTEEIEDGMGEGPGKGRVSPRFGMRRKRKDRMNAGPGRGNKKKCPFREWFINASETLEDVTGMDMDVFAEIPWARLYRDGHSADEAVQEALRIAEEDGDGTEQLSFKEWRSRVNKSLRKMGSVSIQEMRDMGDITNSQLHKLFMNSQGIGKDAKLISSIGDFGEVDEDIEPPRRRSVKKSGGFLDRAGGGSGSRIGELMESLRVRTGKPKSQSKPTLEGIERLGSEAENAKPAYRGDGLVSKVLESPKSTEAPIDESIISDAMAGVAIDNRVASKKKKTSSGEAGGGENVDEASVIGGDYGRWGPATSAASSVGASLTKALSKHLGYQLSFQKEGGANAAKGGTTLWFPMLPDGNKDGFFLGFQIAGKKEDPKWNVILKRGKGLGSASTVASKRGVASGELKSAASGLKGAVVGGQ